MKHCKEWDYQGIFHNFAHHHLVQEFATIQYHVFVTLNID